MAKDPNKIYLPDGSEAKSVDKKAAYKASRERFLVQRENYKNTPSVPQTPKEKAAAAKPGRVSGAEVAAAKKAKRVAQTAAMAVAKPATKATTKPKAPMGKKLTPDQAKLAKAIQRIGAIDKKPKPTKKKGM